MQPLVGGIDPMSASEDRLVVESGAGLGFGGGLRFAVQGSEVESGAGIGSGGGRRCWVWGVGDGIRWLRGWVGRVKVARVGVPGGESGCGCIRMAVKITYQAAGAIWDVTGSCATEAQGPGRGTLISGLWPG